MQNSCELSAVPGNNSITIPRYVLEAALRLTAGETKKFVTPTCVLKCTKYKVTPEGDETVGFTWNPHD